MYQTFRNKSSEIVEGAVKEVPSLPRDLVTPRNIRKDWFTPVCRWLQFFDENSEQKSLLEHVIVKKISDSPTMRDSLLQR